MIELTQVAEACRIDAEAHDPEGLVAKYVECWRNRKGRDVTFTVGRWSVDATDARLERRPVLVEGFTKEGRPFHCLWFQSRMTTTVTRWVGRVRVVTAAVAGGAFRRAWAWGRFDMDAYQGRLAS
jgi:hypothetical protein